MNKFQLLLNTFSDEEIEGIRVNMVNSGKHNNESWNKVLRHLLADIMYIQKQRKLNGLLMTSL